MTSQTDFRGYMFFGDEEYNIDQHSWVTELLETVGGSYWYEPFSFYLDLRGYYIHLPAGDNTECGAYLGMLDIRKAIVVFG
jgi:hypothetical protein